MHWCDHLDERILPRPEPGPVVFAPCNFNSLNKLAHGIADNLALSITAEMIGYGLPVAIGVSVNAPLWAHPQAKASVAVLRSWGVKVVEPQEAETGLMMATTETVLAALSSP